MENKTNGHKNGSGMSLAMRIGALIMAGLMILGTFATVIYAMFS